MNRNSKAMVWALTLIVLLAGSAIAQGQANSPKAPESSGKRIIAYYQNYKGVAVKDIDGNKITHFVYTFLIFDNSTLDIKDGDTFLDVEKFFDEDDRKCTCCARGNYHQVYQLRNKYPHLRTILSIGGWVNSGPFSKVVSTAEGRKKLVEQSTKIMREYGFDGIDIDW
jgi:chitinase